MRPITIRAITPSDHSTRYLSLRAPFDAATQRCYDRNAGWSSLVARWAHNPKVGGSNPPPATNGVAGLDRLVTPSVFVVYEQSNSRAFLLC
jgi:hypothetical protein